MKYIISENRLDSIIQKYISSYIGDELNPVRNSFGDISIDWYAKDDIKRFETYKRVDLDLTELTIDEELWNSVLDIFGISDTSYLRDMFVMWFNNHQNIIKIKIQTDKVYIDDLLDIY